MEWRLREYEVWCEKCQRLFNDFADAADYMPYGTFYMYVRNGDIAIWEAVLANDIFKECTDIIYSFLSSKLSNQQKIERAYLIRGVCCDAAADGSTYHHTPYCPFCKDTITHLSEYVNPPTYQTMDLPEVTHHHWQALTKAQRRQLVIAEMKRKKSYLKLNLLGRLRLLLG